MGAPTGLSTVGARSKSLSDDVYGRSSARTLAKGVASKGNRRKPDRKASQRKAIDEGLPATTRAICPSCLCRGTKTAFSAGKPFATHTKRHLRLCRDKRGRSFVLDISTARRTGHCQKDGHRRDSHQRDGHQARGTFTAGKTATSKMTIERITLEMKTIECGYGHQR